MSKKLKIVAVRMDDDLHNKLQEEATHQRRSLSQMLRLMMEYYFNKNIPYKATPNRPFQRLYSKLSASQE
jgi:hypothetical protein